MQVIAIYGAARAFIAGADIHEFGKPGHDPMLTMVCKTIEDCPKPVISVLHGPTLGGGLEVAISTHARVALPDLITGFPEVTLGIIPGAGGTQRGPRLIGIAETLDLATTGRRIGAQEALALGLIDRIMDGAPRDVALAMAREVIAGTLATRRTADLTVIPDPEAVERVTTQLMQTQAHLFAPHKAVQAVAASTEPLDIGMARERALFDDCIASPQRAGLIHAFFSERAVTKIPEAGVPPRAVASVGVVGGGTMGSGIATACLLSGLPVVLAERDDAALTHGRATIQKNLDRRSKARQADRGSRAPTS